MNPLEASKMTLTKSEQLQEGIDVPRAGAIIKVARGKPPGGPACAAAGGGETGEVVSLYGARIYRWRAEAGRWGKASPRKGIHR